MRRLIELETHLQANKVYLSEDKRLFKTRYIISEEDLCMVYKEIYGSTLSDIDTVSISLNEAQPIYRMCRERGMILRETAVCNEEGDLGFPVIEETMIDIALIVGGKLAKNKEYEIDSRDLVQQIQCWAAEFEANVQKEFDDDYLTAVEIFAERKWRKYIGK